MNWSWSELVQTSLVTAKDHKRLVYTGPVRFFAHFGIVRTSLGLSLRCKRPGLDRTFKHYSRRNDEILNFFNTGFILGWRANIDFRPVINKEAVIAYVAKYASKSETSSNSYEQTLQLAISHLKEDDAAGIAYQKLLSTFSSKRDISGQEICHILLGCSLVKSSGKVRSLCVLSNDSSTARTGLVEKYKTRPMASMENITLLEFATHWDWTKNKYT